MITQDCRSRVLASGGMWHPWRTLRASPDITIHWCSDLPAGLHAATDGERIVMSSRLLQRERRAALAHELEHIRQGRLTECTSRDELRVRQAAARRLIPLDELAAACAWTRDLHELAEELWVDIDTVRCRLQHLHPSERHYLRQRLAESNDAMTGTDGGDSS